MCFAWGEFGEMGDRDDQLMLVNDIGRSSNSKAAGLIKRIIGLMLGFKDYKLKRLSYG